MYPLWRRLGSDPVRLEALVSLYLIQDERRQKSGGEQGTASPVSGGMVTTVIMNLFVGLFAGAALYLPNKAVGLMMCLGLVMAFSVMVLVADYSAVLLDDTDLAVFGPLPVSERTLFLSRVVHIGAYLSITVGSLIVAPLIMGCFLMPFWIFLPVFLVAACLTAVVSLCLAFGLFVVAARFLDLERLKNVLMWLQILVTVLFVGGFQILPRLVDKDLLLNTPEWLLFVAPSGHQGGLLDLALGHASGRNLVLAGLAIVLPVLLAVGLLRLASGGFLSGLCASAVGARSGRRRAKQRVMPPERVLEAAGYDYFANLSSRERQYRMRVYPMVAMSLVLSLAFSFRRGELRQPAMLCMGLYMIGFYAPLFLLVARFGENWQARWILRIAPRKDFGPFVRGAMRALVQRQLLPIFLFVLIVVVAVGGLAVVADALFATLAMLTVALLSLSGLSNQVPFTTKQDRRGAQATAFIMMSLLVVGIVVSVHVFLRQWPVVFTAGLFVLAACVLLAYRRLRNIRLDVDKLLA